MTKAEVNAFRRVLEMQLSAFDGGIKDREALAVDESPDELDRIQSAATRESVIHSIERGALQARNIRGALERIEDGSFGVCVSCENAIQPKRLMAVPAAELCISCQQREDRDLVTRSWNGTPEEELA